MNDLINEFKTKLDDTSLNENDIQRFLEENSELIPTPFLLNHHLHFNVLISKFKICDGFISDYAYLTKSTDFWELVLVEIEDPNKRIFTSNKEQIKFHSEFNHAFDQITEWKAYIEQNPEEIKKRIAPLRVPMGNNPIKFKYVLIYGRNKEKAHDERKTRMFAQKSTDDMRIMTFDSIISSFNYSKENYGKMILSHWKEGYKIKSVPPNLSTSIFAHLTSSTLKLETTQKQILINQGYQIEEWEAGELLDTNEKYTSRYYYDHIFFKKSSR